MKTKIKKLPQLLDRKIYKTGQTRGADDDVIFQNRVGRNSTVLIPYKFWNESFEYPEGEQSLENGYIVLIPPIVYFESPNIEKDLGGKTLVLGDNCVVFYETRKEWDKYNPEKLNWQSAVNRKVPLGGHYVARVPATTAISGGDKVIRGFTTSRSKGAGIRLYEYASGVTIKKCRLQLEGIYWLCFDSIETTISNGLSNSDAETRKHFILDRCHSEGLFDYDRLKKVRIIDAKNKTTCPLCLEQLSGVGFFKRMKQAEGREVPDLTVTEINLFHINELSYGFYNHKPYNVSWGHHHCNVVTKDTGIVETLKWMKSILKKNEDEGFMI